PRFAECIGTVSHGSVRSTGRTRVEATSAGGIEPKNVVAVAAGPGPARPDRQPTSCKSDRKSKRLGATALARGSSLGGISGVRFRVAPVTLSHRSPERPDKLLPIPPHR